jgi:hypothetical protein
MTKEELMEALLMYPDLEVMIQTDLHGAYREIDAIHIDKDVIVLVAP